jgi:hypothetical protein
LWKLSWLPRLKPLSDRKITVVSAPKGRGVERIEEPPDLVIHVGAGGEIGAHDLPPCLVPGLFRRPLAIGDIGGLVDGEARLRPVVIVGMRDVGPADLRGVVLGIEPVGADQVVVRDA